MSWFNHRPKGYKHIRGDAATPSAQPLTGTFDVSRQEAVPPQAQPTGAHEAVFTGTAAAANVQPEPRLAAK